MGVENPIHLVASHCKPWQDSSNDERLDGGKWIAVDAQHRPSGSVTVARLADWPPEDIVHVRRDEREQRSDERDHQRLQPGRHQLPDSRSIRLYSAGLALLRSAAVLGERSRRAPRGARGLKPTASSAVA